MQFKVNNTSVKISFSFFALVLFFIITNNMTFYLQTMSSALFHEIIHIFFILLFKGRIESVSLTFLGGNIKRRTACCLSFIKEAIIHISAPFANLIVSYIFLKIFGKINGFVAANFLLGFFNALPFYSFDGGHFLLCILQNRFSYKVSDIVVTITSILTAFTLCFFTLSLYIKYDEVNLSLMIFAAYCFILIIFKK